MTRNSTDKRPFGHNAANVAAIVALITGMVTMGLWFHAAWAWHVIQPLCERWDGPPAAAWATCTFPPRLDDTMPLWVYLGQLASMVTVALLANRWSFRALRAYRERK